MVGIPTARSRPRIRQRSSSSLRTSHCCREAGRSQFNDEDPLGLRAMFGERRGVSLSNTLANLVQARNRSAHDGPIRSKREIAARIQTLEPQLLNAIDLTKQLAKTYFLLVERSSR